jgi:isopentenyl-diphosphate Delta-isomerase
MTGREDLLVELTDETGAGIGACTVAEAHAAPGRRHRAFSALLYDHAGQILLQQRAAVKARFASRWSNSCCGHPAPGEHPAAAAVRRLSDELGIDPGDITPLTEAGVFRYQATDPGSGLVEREWDHVLVATLTGGPPRPAAAEVSRCTWISLGALLEDLARRPGAYTPWLPGVLDIATRARARARARASG